MPERVIPESMGGLISLGAADDLCAGLTGGSRVPVVSAVFTRSPGSARAGYVLLGATVVRVEARSGRLEVSEAEVRRAAVELDAMQVDFRSLVRIGPFGGAPAGEYNGTTLMRWRQRIMQELQEPVAPKQTAQCEDGRRSHLAGIDWRRILVERSRDPAVRTWWLPRGVVRLLDAAAHAEAHWLQAAGTHQADAVVEATSPPAQAHTVDGRRTAEPERSTARLRPYRGELQGQLYSALTRRPGTSGKVAGWTCAVCRTAPAAVLDHCHEHGYVRAPVCQSCNTQERPDHLYSNDVRVAGRYQRLFDTDAAHWLPHWHCCPGCRARTTLPLPHLAAWTAHVGCRRLRPTHRDACGSRGRKPCGVLRVSWKGSQNAPRSCLLTIVVDGCPSGEHRVLAQVPYREAVQQFGVWLAETAPAVAAAAGPDRLDGLPARPRPVIADPSGEGLELFWTNTTRCDSKRPVTVRKRV
ncbi:endonuclease domain-containing protein [Streptomyces sp900105245]|uniref:Endonuclease domain-containing protein n=1 Tax=Streptomyces sp. 900105245 TaxID=3154379 RepID=A0ABV1UL04_9ACTN